MSGHSGLSDNTLSTQEIPPQSSSSVQNGAGVNMAGWDGVQFIINFGAFGVNSTLDARVVRDDNSGFNSATNIAGAAITQIVNANGIAIIDVYRPSEQFVRAVVTPAVNAVLISCIATRYRRGGVLPATQSAVQVVKVVEN